MSRLRGCHALMVHMLLLCAAEARAQQSEHGTEAGPRLEVGAHAVGILTHVTPAVLGDDLTEGYLTQPAVMARWSLPDHVLAVHAMLNLEGWTLGRGELSPGIWGEGYIDRRHPHTYLHEAVATLSGDLGGIAASLTAGKGFAPFGTDDPMVRGFIKYPANHHLAQVLERLIAIAAVRYRLVALEAGLLNGDEPLGPSSNGTLDHVGDSWAIRGTAEPARGFELQISRAHLESPELPQGGGPNHHKLSASARVERAALGGQVYALAEYARTGYVTDGRERFAFTSVLGELSMARGGWSAAARFERTVRPEEERQLEGFPFRSVRPPTDFSILGRTRWTIGTLQLARRIRYGSGSITPIVEIERSHAETVNRPAVYEPRQFFGDDVLWTFSFGMRLTAGAPHARMGRYGVAVMDGRHQHH